MKTSSIESAARIMEMTTICDGSTCAKPSKLDPVGVVTVVGVGLAYVSASSLLIRRSH
jgi:hypothetical protein